MTKLCLGLSVVRRRRFDVLGEGSTPNIDGSTLVLFNEDNETWYAFPITDDAFGEGIAIATPPGGSSETLVIECPQDETTHLVGAKMDAAGKSVIYTEQDPSIEVGVTLSLNGRALIIYKDAGDSYFLIPD